MDAKEQERLKESLQKRKEAIKSTIPESFRKAREEKEKKKEGKE